MTINNLIQKDLNWQQKSFCDFFISEDCGRFPAVWETFCLYCLELSYEPIASVHCHPKLTPVEVRSRIIFDSLRILKK